MATANPTPGNSRSQSGANYLEQKNATEPVVIKPSALGLWRNACQSLTSEAKARERSFILEEAMRNQTIPPWAVFLESWPPYLLPLNEDFTRLARRHAVEFMDLASRTLKASADQDNERGSALLQTTASLKPRPSSST